ncbi:hypothetical protein [Microbacterium sp. P05]|uniref:hypothetical protein n=1 Tax=Microbacterium sp. P05 TaxID=3366948 RepID=UPI00374593C7
MAQSRVRWGLLVAGIVLIAAAVVGGWMLTSPAGSDAAAPSASGSAAGPVAGTEAEAGDPAQAMPEHGTEALPPDTARSNTPPSVAPPTPRLPDPLPVSASARGSLVVGYPVEVAAPLEHSEVLDSSVAGAPGTLQFTLVAHSEVSPEQIVEQYRAAWSGIALSPEAEPSAGATASFRDAFTSVTVSAETGGTGTVYSIFGVLKAG